jgi:sugar diacid utilization regulator
LPKIVSVKSILQLPALAGAKVLAGLNGLDKEVRAVTVAEIPDIAQWLAGGDFVHSVAWFMNEQNSRGAGLAILDWAAALYGAGASCLAIKTKRFVEEIPPALLKFGDEHDFPVIELPPGVTQGEVTECVLRAVIGGREMFDDRRAQAFSDVCAATAGKHGLKTIADKLCGHLGNPVVIEDIGFNLLAAPAAASPLARQAVAARLGQEAVAALSKNKSVIICAEESALSFPCGEKTLQQVIFPVRAQDRLLGYVSLIEAEGRISEEDKILLKTCLGAVAMCMGQRLAFEFSGQRVMEDFLQSLLAADFDENHSSCQADMAGFDCKGGKTAVVISIRDKNFAGQGAAHFELFVNSVARSLREHIKSSDGAVFIGNYKVSIVYFADFGTNGPAPVKKSAMQLVGHIETSYPGTDVVMGIGRKAHSVRDCRKSCLEAMDAVKCIRDLDLSDKVKILSYKDMGQYSLLLSILRDSDAAERFCASVLGALIDGDKRGRTDLVETLGVYLDANCSYAKAAAQMFMHINTMKYRIRQIKDILPVDISSFADRSTVWLALQVYRRLKKNK